MGGNSPPAGTTVGVTVTNTGDRAGDAVPEAYVSLPSRPGVAEPPWQLKGFAKVHLAPGESTRAEMPLQGDAFSYCSTAGNDSPTVPRCSTVALATSSPHLPP